jgi:hypothetical protein
VKTTSDPFRLWLIPMMLQIARIAFVSTFGLALTAAASASPECSSLNYASSQLLAKQANGAFQLGDWQHANRLADNGLKTLGYSYVPTRLATSIIDDTGQHLSLAYYWHLHGSPRKEALVKIHVLQSRLEQFRQSYSCTKS